MGYRQVVIKKADKMKLKDNNLVVLNNEIERKILKMKKLSKTK